MAENVLSAVEDAADAQALSIFSMYARGKEVWSMYSVQF